MRELTLQEKVCGVILDGDRDTLVGTEAIADAVIRLCFDEAARVVAEQPAQFYTLDANGKVEPEETASMAMASTLNTLHHIFKRIATPVPASK